MKGQFLASQKTRVTVGTGHSSPSGWDMNLDILHTIHSMIINAYTSAFANVDAVPG
jgi:hypothetical protein